MDLGLWICRVYLSLWVCVCCEIKLMNNCEKDMDKVLFLFLDKVFLMCINFVK